MLRSKQRSVKKRSTVKLKSHQPFGFGSHSVTGLPKQKLLHFMMPDETMWLLQLRLDQEPHAVWGNKCKFFDGCYRQRAHLQSVVSPLAQVACNLYTLLITRWKQCGEEAGQSPSCPMWRRINSQMRESWGDSNHIRGKDPNSGYDIHLVSRT